MNFLAWILCLSVLIILMIQAVSFHRATVCRQEAWLKSTELSTNGLLTGAKASDRLVAPGCKLIVLRNQGQVTWQVLPTLKKHRFSLPLDGQL